jgi:hypothetical protein
MEKVADRFRFPLMAMGLLALLAAMWAGLVRLGWGWPPLRPTLPMSHGPLMVSGFLGTVIGLERAVALAALNPAQVGVAGITLKTYRWTYLGPLLTGLGALLLIVGIPGFPGPLLMTLGSLGLVLVFALIMRMHLALFTVTMMVGAVLWLVGNSLWLLGWPIYTIVAWWGGFLVLTIAGERLELGRVLRLPRAVQIFFGGTLSLLLMGLVVSLFNLAIGLRLVGAGMVVLALWLLCYDVARYTVRKSGLTRFMALCLLIGYGWLGVSGLLGLFYGPVTAGPHYDAVQHTVFVGFVISMIFGHAPIILPAILGKSFTFQPIFYSHLVLLHLSLLLRVIGDLTTWLPGRQWGGLLNVVALLLFLANTFLAIRPLRRTSTNQPFKPI